MWRRTGSKFRTIIQKPEIVFALLATIFGIFSAFAVPQLSVPDENMHFLRIYMISTGNIIGNENNDCTFPQDIYNRGYSIYDGDYAAHYKQKINHSNTITEWCGTAASYSPLVYIPQTIGFVVANLFWPSTGLMILLGRLASLVFFVTVMYFVIKKVRIGKWCYVVIALFPTVIHQVASLSADSMTYLAILATFAFMLNLLTQKSLMSRRQIVYVLLLAGSLTLTKIPDAVLLLFILFLPSHLFAYKSKNKSLFLKPFAWKLYILFAAVLFGYLVAFIWQTIYGQPLVDPSLQNPLRSNPLQFIPVLFHTFVYMDPKQTIFGFTGLGGFSDFILSSAVGGFASYRYWLPELLIFACYALLVFTLLRSDKHEERLLKKHMGKASVGGLLLLLILVVGISYSLYILWAVPLLGPKAIYAAGIQGRYFTAAFVLLIPAGFWLRKHIAITVKNNIVYCTAVSVTSGFLLLFYSLQTLYAIRLGFF